VRTSAEAGNLAGWCASSGKALSPSVPQHAGPAAASCCAAPAGVDSTGTSCRTSEVPVTGGTTFTITAFSQEFASCGISARLHAHCCRLSTTCMHPSTVSSHIPVAIPYTCDKKAHCELSGRGQTHLVVIIGDMIRLEEILCLHAAPAIELNLDKAISVSG
jgi:hypothetical protein